VQVLYCIIPQILLMTKLFNTEDITLLRCVNYFLRLYCVVDVKRDLCLVMYQDMSCIDLQSQPDLCLLDLRFCIIFLKPSR